jgi:hypothetical protein
MRGYSNVAGAREAGIDGIEGEGVWDLAAVSELDDTVQARR